MKCELLVWKNSFKHLRFKQILSIPFFYILRIFLINKFLMNKKKLPISIGVRSNLNHENSNTLWRFRL